MIFAPSRAAFVTTEEDHGLDIGLVEVAAGKHFQLGFEGNVRGRHYGWLRRAYLLGNVFHVLAHLGVVGDHFLSKLLDVIVASLCSSQFSQFDFSHSAPEGSGDEVLVRSAGR